jgi:hypothetical protein
MDYAEILYIHYHQDLVEQSRYQQLFKALGVLWSKEDLNRKPDKDAPYSDEVFIPLSMVINPKVLDIVKSDKSASRKQGEPVRILSDGTPIDASLGPVKSMGDLSKDEFFRLIGQPIPSSMSAEAKAEMKKKWVK